MVLVASYHGSKPIEDQSVGNWIDLRSAEDVSLNAFEYRKISLGFCLAIPEGFEVHIAPRSSTYEKWGILLTNGVTVIDRPKDPNAPWRVPVLAMRATQIYKGDRIVQFRIMPKQPKYTIAT